MVSNGRRVPFFGAPDLNSADHPWAGYSFEEAISKAEPVPSHYWPRTTLQFATGGQASVRWKHRGVWDANQVQAGMVAIMRRDVEIQSALPSGEFPLMLLQLDSSKLQHFAPDQILAIDSSSNAPQITNDQGLAALMMAMRAEVREGCSSGRLYAESISLALLAYLAAKYATPRFEEDRAARLSPAQKRSIVDHIRANLANDIAVSEVAALVQMSPSHFARVFKATFGVTPYRYVMRQRIEEAKGMLASKKLSASQVATEFGFSSQSHFVKVFRQFTGVTPKQFKAGF
jgi:AraC family transcriptional regulator